jgi:hypothetical protein
MFALRHKNRIFVFALVALGFFLVAARKHQHKVSREDVERAHGLFVPVSASQIQQKECGFGVLDHGILSIFQLPSTDIDAFTNQLQVTANASPIVLEGNPLENSASIWPTNSHTFVPGNSSLSGLRQTWRGPAKPIEMLSCKSSKGDWLHVEVWAVDDERLIKLYTDWN